MTDQVNNEEKIQPFNTVEITANEVKALELIERLVANDELATNAILSRLQSWQQLLDPQRNINKECGYPEVFIPIQSYRDMYDRDPIAARVVEVYPSESWQVQPSVYEDEDSETETEFESAWKAVHKNLQSTYSAVSDKTQGSYYQDEEGSLIWSYLLRLDVQSGIGHYGCLLMGIDDGRDLSDPIEGFEDLDSQIYLGTEGQYGPNPFYPYAAGYDSVTQEMIAGQYKARIDQLSMAPVMMPGTEQTSEGEDPQPRGARRLIYLRVFDESLAQITQYERDPRNPRFGLPVRYLITFNDPRNDPSSAAGLPVATAWVHWSRILHFADKLGSNEVLAYPRMKQCYNRLVDLCKIYAASGEGFWQMAFAILSGETHPSLGGDVKMDNRAIAEQMSKIRTGLKRHLTSAGMAWKTLAPVVSDPTPFKDAGVEAICILLGCPKRVFMGSERGELASSQDDSAWNDRLRHRQLFLLTPRMIVPFIDRLIHMKVLPQPRGYSVVWPDLESLSDTDKANIANTKMTAISTMFGGQPEAGITPMDFWTKIVGMDQEEAEQIVENAQKALEEESHMSPSMAPAEESPIHPVKMRQGESLVHPETGETVAESETEEDTDE